MEIKKCGLYIPLTSRIETLIYFHALMHISMSIFRNTIKAIIIHPISYNGRKFKKKKSNKFEKHLNPTVLLLILKTGLTLYL